MPSMLREEPTPKTWAWVGQYGIAIILVLLLGTLLGSLPLFKESAVGETRLRASHLVQFLGYGGALVLFWLFGQRAAVQLADDGKGLAALRHIISPLVTLIVLAAGYQVLLLLVGPLLGKTGRTLYNWAFITGIIGTALWLTVAWFNHSAALMESFRGLGRLKPTLPNREVPCPTCGAGISAESKFCAHCGARLSRT